MLYRIDVNPKRIGDSITLQGSITEEQAITLLEAIKGIWPEATMRKPMPMRWVEISKPQDS
jgi:hypothetical protein